jgi:hypothetical protein
VACSMSRISQLMVISHSLNMAFIRSPESRSGGIAQRVGNEYKLEHTYQNRVSFTLALKCEDRRLRKTTRHSSKGDRFGRFAGKSCHIVHLCTHCPQFKVVARISQARDTPGLITVMEDECVLFHSPHCPGGPSNASRADIMQDKQFTQGLLRCTHNDEVRDLARTLFGVVPCNTTCTNMRNDAKKDLAADGYDDNFRVRVTWTLSANATLVLLCN